MRSYRKSSHSLHDLKVHLVWITKYRYKVLNPEIGVRIRAIIRQICDSKDIQIIKGNISQDHVHIYVSYPPKISVSEMVRFFKGRSSRKIQEEFPQLSKAGYPQPNSVRSMSHLCCIIMKDHNKFHSTQQEAAHERIYKKVFRSGQGNYQWI